MTHHDRHDVTVLERSGLVRDARFRWPAPQRGARRPARGIRLAAVLIVVCATLAWRAPASAHPHVWITSSSELVYAPDGSLTAVRHAWTFDDMFSTFALQGLETKVKGVYSREELAPLAQTNVESLKEFRFFTFARTSDDGAAKKQKFLEPVDYWLEHKDGALTLHFTLPLKTPVKSRELALEIFDPTYFIDFSLAQANPVRLVGAPAGCTLAIARPTDGAVQAKALGEDNFLDGSNANFGASFANKITVQCP